MEMNFTTSEDAKTYVYNSGVIDWEWGGTASLDRFARWIWKNYNHMTDDIFDDALRDYLKSEGEDPADYSI